MVDVEQIRLEPVALGNCAGIRHDRGRFAVTSVYVVPEREVRAPLHLHQRRDLRPRENRLDTRDEFCRSLAFGLPVDVIEQRRCGHNAQVEVGLHLDQLIEAPRAQIDLLVFRPAHQKRNQPRRARPQLAFRIEISGSIGAQESLELG